VEAVLVCECESNKDGEKRIGGTRGGKKGGESFLCHFPQEQRPRGDSSEEGERVSLLCSSMPFPLPSPSYPAQRWLARRSLACPGEMVPEERAARDASERVPLARG